MAMQSYRTKHKQTRYIIRKTKLLPWLVQNQILNNLEYSYKTKKNDVRTLKSHISETLGCILRYIIDTINRKISSIKK